MTISGGSALPKDEIDRMVKDAEAHAEEDKRRREEAEARNGAEQLVYSTEKFLKDNEDKIPADSRPPVDSALAELKEALKSDSTTPAEISEKSEMLAKVSQELGTAMYAAAQAAESDAAESASTSTGGSGSGANPDGGGADHHDDSDVVDAEVVDEDK
jgi:molecular chaperone DnaK